jgi:hypothetical protein
LDAVARAYYNTEAHFLLGAALHRLGRVPQAVEALRVAVRQNPNYVRAHTRLARIYEKRLRDCVTAEEHREAARKASERIAEIRRGGVSARPAMRDRRPMTPPPSLVQEHQQLSVEMTVPLSETIIVVSGLPRSGTSMMMQMLAAGGLSPFADGSRPADEFNAAGYYEHSRAKHVATDSTWLREARGKAVKLVAQLLPRMPSRREQDYRVIFMERPLNQVIASQQAMLSGQGRTGAALSAQQLQRTFESQLESVRNLLALGAVPTLYLAYEDCLNHAADTAARINAFLGGNLDEQAMAAAVRSDLRHY